MTRSVTVPDLVSLATFRGVMGSFASGVSVVTTLDDGVPKGMTCTATCSVSAEPPLLLTCFRKPSGTLDALTASGHFAVNFLDTDARDVAKMFASQHPDKFGEVAWRPGVTGVPVLSATLAHAECTVYERFDVGDHAIVIGAVVGGEVDGERLPLGYWRGSYVRLFRMSNPGWPATMPDPESDTWTS